MKFKITLVLFLVIGSMKAQMPLAPSKHNLEKRISIEVKNEQVSDVLNKISKAGDFFFSYSGTLIKTDSLITVNIRNAPVRELLDQLFKNKIDYRENGDYIILRYAANRLTIEPQNITTAEKLYIISGYVTDTQTGRKVKQASVYEKRLLQSTLTNNDGYFSLKFKGDHSEVILTASKETYRDTTLIFLSDIKIKPEGYKNPDGEEGGGVYGDVESSGIGRFFISSRQRIQSLNIPGFFANSPFQASFTPGLSSHGIMSPQVVNNFSLNILGGYTAGSNGFEIAGLFNINKGDVKKLQFAGLFNVTGGSVNGIQVAGLLNDVSGEQRGFQAASLLNKVNGSAEGVQVSGLGNFASARMRGIQISGLFNYAKKMDGFQLGLINVADTSSGYSLGLINIVKKGYHKISISANETTNTNLAIKTGNAKLYTILFAGVNVSENEKAATAGLGIGHDFIFNNRFSLAAELTGQLLYLGDWDNTNGLNRIQTHLQVQIFKGLTLFGGPAYSIYNADESSGPIAPGYKQNVIPSHHTSFGGRTKGWLGFNAGITIM